MAKIIANEIPCIYLNKRLVKLETNTQVEENLQKDLKYPFRFTGKKIFLIELGDSLVFSGDINNGNVEIKEMMNILGTVFQVELDDYYAAYITIKNGRNWWTENEIFCSTDKSRQQTANFRYSVTKIRKVGQITN